MNKREISYRHKNHNLFKTKQPGTFYKLESRKYSISRGFQEAFSTADAMLFLQNTYKIGKNAVEMSQASHDIAGFEHFTVLSLFKYAFNVIQKWETDALQFYSICTCASFLSVVVVEGDESTCS